MDELVYEEFKGTGNMELHLDRKLANRRVYPAIDVINSSTRNEDLLFSNAEYQSVVLLRRMIDIVNQGNGGGDSLGYVQDLINKLQKTKSNKEFLASLKEG
jgi:transcription termination factor Rho